MSVKPNVDSHFEAMTYAQLRERCEGGETMELLRVQGVATMHRLFLDSEKTTYDKLVYIVTPESGPYDYIVNRFPNEQRDLTVWNLPAGVQDGAIAEFDRICLAAQHFVVDKAHEELQENR